MSTDPHGDLPTDQPDSSAPQPDLEERFRTASAGVKLALPGQVPPTPTAMLQQLVEETGGLDNPTQWDRYGAKGPVDELESRVAELLDKPAAVMFPSGVMAQQATLRVWADRRGTTRVAVPALSHLLRHEKDGPQLLHGFRWEWLTSGAQVPKAADLAKIPGQLAAVLIELPLRDGGFLLPTWQELVDLSDACRTRGVPLHIDGARIWESRPNLGHSLAEVADLADTVYVSFYKGLRGLAGAAVAGPEDVVVEVRDWRTRHGGTLFTMFPYAVSGLRGLRVELPRMTEYHERAIELAKALTARGVTCFPEPPHTNAFRLLVPYAPDEVVGRVVDVMESEKLFVTPPWSPADVPGWSWTEFTVGPATMEISAEEAADKLAAVLLGNEASPPA